MKQLLAVLIPLVLMPGLPGCGDSGGGPLEHGGLGQPCYDDGTCQAGYACTPVDDTCIRPEDDCGDLECGPSPNLGYDCGGCPGETTWCNDEGRCIDDCEGLECGPSANPFVECGTCPGQTEYCDNDGQCVDACAGRECGPAPREGFDCGPCGSDRAVCDVAGQCHDDWDPRFDPFVQALLADLAASDAYGVSAAIMENGQITFSQAFGSKDLDGQVPLTPDALMQIGSTTKQMTAVVLLRNAEAGQVSLDDLLVDVLPELTFALTQEWVDQVTLYHLLTHQGAFYDTLSWGDPADDALLADWTYDEYATNYFLMAPPGSFWNYSNPNFTMAGLVSETLDDRAWPDIIAEDVFAPLGMDRTYLRKAEVEADGNYAMSYGFGIDDLEDFELGPVEMADMSDPGSARPAGLVWTTPSQMMTWATFLMDGDPTVLSDALREQINTAQVPTLSPYGDEHYGYGQFVHGGYLALDGTWYETPVWEHGGNTYSFSHFFYVLPEQGFALAIAISCYAADFSSSADTAITSLVDLPAPTPAPPVEIDPAEFDKHVGNYRARYSWGRIEITRDGDGLLIDMPDLERYGHHVGEIMYPISSNDFISYVNSYPVPWTFIPLTEGGDSEYIRNRSVVGIRTDRSGGDDQASPPTKQEMDRILRLAQLDIPPIWPVLPKQR